MLWQQSNTDDVTDGNKNVSDTQCVSAGHEVS